MSWAVIPVKDFARAKSRLSPALSAEERAVLARRLFDHVFECVQAAAPWDGILICTDSDEVAELAESAGAEVQRDEGEPLNVIVDRALEHLAPKAELAVVLMGDLPLLTSSALDRLRGELTEAEWVLSPDHRGHSTNAFALHLVSRRPTAFGDPESYAKHLNCAGKEGLSMTVIDGPALAIDIDLPEDLAHLPESLR